MQNKLDMGFQLTKRYNTYCWIKKENSKTSNWKARNPNSSECP